MTSQKTTLRILIALIAACSVIAVVHHLSGGPRQSAVAGDLVAVNWNSLTVPPVPPIY